MFLVQRSIVRESKDVSFYRWPDEYRAYFKERYLDTKKASRSEMTIGADNMSLIVTTLWESEEAFKEFLADPVIQHHMALRREYNEKNNITSLSPNKMSL